MAGHTGDERHSERSFGGTCSGHPFFMNACSTYQNDLTKRLDDLEESLPTLPSKSLQFGRAATRRVIDTTVDIVTTISRSVNGVVDEAATSAKTTAGQTRAAVDRSATTARDSAREAAEQARAAVDRTTEAVRTSAKQAAGQARAEAGQVVDAASSAAEQLLDEGTQAVDPDRPNPGIPYARWTKSQLYDRAQELDIEGRSAMTKKELVEALRSS